MLGDFYKQYVLCVFEAFFWVDSKTENLGIKVQPFFFLLFMITMGILLPQWVWLAVAVAIGIPLLTILVEIIFIAIQLDKSR